MKCTCRRVDVIIPLLCLCLWINQPQDTKIDRFMDTELDLLEARLEQHVFKEVNRNTLEIEKDIQHVEERLEQVIFREVLRLKNSLLAQKEEEEEAALDSKPVLPSPSPSHPSHPSPSLFQSWSLLTRRKSLSGWRALASAPTHATSLIRALIPCWWCATLLLTT